MHIPIFVIIQCVIMILVSSEVNFVLFLFTLESL